MPFKRTFGEITDGGIGYELRKLIAERALSARLGVELPVNWLKNGVIMLQEEHILLLTKMKHGCLRLSGENSGSLREYPMIMLRIFLIIILLKRLTLMTMRIFLLQKTYCLCQRRGWFKPESDGEFNFSKVYSAERNLASMSNIGRMWIGVKMLSGKEYKHG